MKSESSALVVLSGGQDSVTCLGLALKLYSKVKAICFIYGQRHEIEVDCAINVCVKYGVDLKLVELPFVTQLVSSALTDVTQNVNVQSARNPSLPSTFVPVRNALFLTLAHGYAQEQGFDVIVTGVCQTDYSGYPDCRAAFVTTLEAALNLGYESHIHISTPLMQLDKGDTFQLAEELDFLPDVLEMSHTCYLGDHETPHRWGFGCGECPACKLRARGWETYLARKAAGIRRSLPFCKAE